MDYKQKARDFVENDKPFHLGFLPTEQANPLTAGMDEVFARSAADGVRMLQRVDRNVLEMARRVFASQAFGTLVECGLQTIRNGGRLRRDRAALDPAGGDVAAICRGNLGGPGGKHYDRRRFCSDQIGGIV